MRFAKEAIDSSSPVLSLCDGMNNTNGSIDSSIFDKNFGGSLLRTESLAIINPKLPEE